MSLLEPNTFSKDNLPPVDDFQGYRKKTLTLMAGPYPPPVTIVSREGQQFFSDEPHFVAIDPDGYPYAVAQSVVERTYELVE